MESQFIVPILRTFKGKEKRSLKIGEFEKSGVKLQCSTEERWGNNSWFEFLEKFEKKRVRENEITLNCAKCLMLGS